jgi:hypothetical protein
MAAPSARPPGVKYPCRMANTPTPVPVVRSILAVLRNSSNSALRPSQIFELCVSACACGVWAAAPAGAC